MKIFFDHQAFSTQTFGGISRYIVELIRGINQTSTNEAYLSLLLSNNIHLHEARIEAYSFFSNQKFPKKTALLYWINEYYSIFQMRQKKFDIFHATYYDPYFIPSLKGKPFVITFHDMIHEKFSDQYTEFGIDKHFTKQKKILADQATRIVAISESTKQDVVNIFDIDPNKIQVIYHGSPIVFDDSIVDNPVKPYLLYVGNRQRYKNFRGLLRSIAPLLTRYKVELICAGGGSFDYDEQTLIKSLQMSSYVKYYHIDNDKTLWRLYKSAIAFVFPSKYEGFGIPILEAFACGCPCILSNASSLPEVAGEAAFYFDPNNDDSIKYAVEEVIINEELRSRLIKSGNRRLSEFSWDHTVSETLAVYKMCL